MWISEAVEQKRQRQAAGAVRYGHLQIFEGGKFAAGVYVRPIGRWRRIRNWLARRSLSLRLAPGMLVGREQVVTPATGPERLK